MTWLFVGLGAAFVGILIYYSIPFFKKLKNVEKKDSSKKEEKKLARQERKEEKLEKKNNLKQKGQETSQGSVVSAGDDFFEDPDTKVNYENFDLGGYFEETPKINNNFENEHFEDDPFSENVNDMFESYFENDIHPSERTPKGDPFAFISDASIDGNDDEIQGFLEELNRVSSGGESNLSEDFKNLSPEMKALMISNFLDRKDI